ncbi:divalent-cation tolerance protein CutA [Niveibacterium sp. SC-1]|uniref:divalent-cation tolerance protein CutA n=1 Tax=Niveibacterium sp. SC-1 TaxID=3135646 RepID=UPI00311F555D
MSEALVLVLCNCPDAQVAEQIGRQLIERRLAACVNLLAPVRSIYRWQGKVEFAEEIPLLAKTCQARVAELESAIRELHPYELPEILHLTASALPAYLAWVEAETLPENRLPDGL